MFETLSAAMQSFWWLHFLLLVGSMAQSDVDVLLKLKNGVQRDPLGRLDSWRRASIDSNGCPNNWFGIECRVGYVTNITLPDLGLGGTIDFSSISRLKMLRNLSIRNNSFTGTLSHDIGFMMSLQHLDLSGNSMEGHLPSGLTNLQGLVYLNLSSNNFSGNLPSGFQKLRQLKYIDLHSNNLEGDIGSWIPELQNVIHVDLSFNMFHGSFPRNINNLTFTETIQHLNISHNQLSGQLFTPGLVPLFDNLEVFDASYNQLNGEILGFTSMVALQTLQLQSNKFSGDLPIQLLKESSMVLTYLDISLNHFQGPVSRITSSTLKFLNLSYNAFSGSLPSSVGHCAVVDFSNNRLMGNLAALQSWGNYVEYVDLSSNLLFGTLPNETSLFLRLITMKISNNSLEGLLPNTVGKYIKLNVLDLSHNKLSGPLPLGIFESSTLNYLNLSGNNFNGPITFVTVNSSVYSLLDSASMSNQNSSLEFLDLSNNMFSGLLPSGLGNLINLQVLDLNKNAFLGPIPHEISKLKGLIHLDLSNNNLNGSIPDGLSVKLQVFNVSYNNLSGSVPGNLLNFPDSSFLPGNSLLIFPRAPPKSGPSISVNRRGQNHLKHVVIEALIAGSVGGVIVIIILWVLISYKTQSCRSGGQQNSKINGRDNNHERSSRPNLFGLQKNCQSKPTSSFSRDHLLSSDGRSLSTLADVALTINDPVEQSQPRSTAKSVQTANSYTVESLPPRSSKQTSLGFACSPTADASTLMENSAGLKVPSPDRLAGDLHFFDTSYVFSAEKLSCAPAEVLGRSSHGTSYKATLENGHMLTVKWLREGLAKRKKEFSREAKKLGNIRHPNIVTLRGYYWGLGEHEKLILSDYLDGKSLAHYLFEPEPRKYPPLTLDQRLKVSIDVARCLNYLHNEGGLPHGNLKATNILLETHSMNAFLTDYSLHRLMSPAGTAEQILNTVHLNWLWPKSPFHL